MKSLGISVAVLVLLPVSARAQSVKMADLAGTWIATSKKGAIFEQGGADTLTFRPDSTFQWDKQPVRRLYRFTGDSLFFSEGPVSVSPGFRIVLKDQQLTLTNELGTLVNKRVDAPKSTP